MRGAQLMIKIRRPNVHHTQLNRNNTRFLGNKNTSFSKKDKIKIGCGKRKTQFYEFNLHTKAIISMCSLRAHFDAKFPFEAPFEALCEHLQTVEDLLQAVLRYVRLDSVRWFSQMCAQFNMQPNWNKRSSTIAALGMLEIRIYCVCRQPVRQPDRRTLCTSA